MNRSGPLLVVLGTTASGKSEIAVRLAERFGGEVVGCDSMQVYRGFVVGTGAPGPELRARAPHHLIGIADPGCDFSLGEYVRLAAGTIAAVEAGGRRAVVAGGTGLYLRGLLRGVFEGPRRDEALWARLTRAGDKHGSAYLHAMLRRVDPASADRLPPRDLQRVVRALEVFFATGRPMSEQIASHGFLEERWRAVKIGLTMPRALLWQRIEERLQRFFEAGWEDEVRRLLTSGPPETANAWKALGYREVARLVRREIGREQAIEAIARETRRYAKRQMTWFRREPGVVWFEHEGTPPWEAIEAAAVSAR